MSWLYGRVFTFGILFLLYLMMLSAQEKDLCLVGNGGCEHHCTNLDGISVRCNCHTNFGLNKTDNASCYDLKYCTNLHGPGFVRDPEQFWEFGRCVEIKLYTDLVRVYLAGLKVDYCAANHGCPHTCVSTLYEKKCVCDRGYITHDEGRRCEKPGGWRSYYTIIAVAVILFLIILFIICCCCARLAILRENICCKSFISWKCCMTGCFCKCNKGEADETTELYYHHVNINVKKNKEEQV